MKHRGKPVHVLAKQARVCRWGLTGKLHADSAVDRKVAAEYGKDRREPGSPLHTIENRLTYNTLVSAKLVDYNGR